MVLEEIVIHRQYPSERTWRGKPHSTIESAVFVSGCNLISVARTLQFHVQEEVETRSYAVSRVKGRRVAVGIPLAVSAVSSFVPV
jgi:hypothetical protein